MQTQTSNTLHNAITEADSKDRPPMLAPGNYVQWKFRIKRYNDTKPNHDFIHYCLENPPYQLDWTNIEVPVSEGSPITTTERIRINNDIYSTVDACTNACEMWKEIERLKHGESINVQDLETNLYWEFGKFTSQDEWQRFVTLVKQSQELKTVSYLKLEKMLLCKQEEAGIQLNANQADWRDDTDDDESEDQELEANYMYMAQLQEVSPDTADSGLIFDDEPLQKVSNDDHYNVEEIDQNADDNDLAEERELLASLIEKLKCEIDESKNRNKFLETSNKVLIEKLKGEIKDFNNKNKSLESSNNFFKEANNRLSETNNLMYADYKKSEAELARRNSIEYATQMELECEKVRGDLLSYKMDYQKSCTKYTDTINALNQTISKMKSKLSAHQETISILSKQKEAQIKLYKTQEDNELDKVIELENKVKVLDNIVYKTGQRSDSS
nr:hypothetical protein [Tanacetum cinerariifolium]